MRTKRTHPRYSQPPSPRNAKTAGPQALQLSAFTGAYGAQVTDLAALLAPPGAARLRRLWVRAPQIQEPALVAIGRLTGLEVRGPAV
jgi:hypothetical protein